MLKYLPSDDPHIAGKYSNKFLYTFYSFYYLIFLVQSRGGPNTYEVTSWLQILRTQISDTGKTNRMIIFLKIDVFYLLFPIKRFLSLCGQKFRR